MTSPDAGGRFAVTHLSDEALASTLHRLPTGVIVIDRHHAVVYANVVAKRLFHAEPLRIGRALPEISSDRSLGDLATRLFRTRAVRQEVVRAGDLTLAFSGSLDRQAGYATLVVEDVSRRSDRHRSEDDFVVNASHEILSPIAAIAGAVQVLQDGAKDDPAALERFLSHIAEASNRLTSTATALLVLARAEAGVGGPRLELVLLRPVLEGLSRGKDGVRVNCGEKVAVLADADVVRQAIRILVENARLHAPGAVDINVDDAGEMVVVDVVDHGKGILPENLETVTQRFSVGDGRSTGYGIGLSIAERSAKVLGGTLDLASDRAGTRARLRLPSARLL